MAYFFWEPTIRTAEQRRVPVPWRHIAMPSLVTLFGGIIFYALVVQLPYVLTGLEVTNVGLIGAGTALASLATAAGSFSFRFTAKHGPNRLLPVAFSLAGSGLLAVWFSTTVPLALAGAVVTSAGTGLMLPTLLTWAVSGLRLEQRGRGAGIWTGSLYIGQFVSPIILGITAAVFGGLPLALGVLGILSLVAAAVLAVTRPQRERVPAE